jgi:hypothetical protein
MSGLLVIFHACISHILNGYTIAAPYHIGVTSILVCLVVSCALGQVIYTCQEAMQIQYGRGSAITTHAMRLGPGTSVPHIVQRCSAYLLQDDQWPWDTTALAAHCTISGYSSIFIQQVLRNM